VRWYSCHYARSRSASGNADTSSTDSHTISDLYPLSYLYTHSADGNSLAQRNTIAPARSVKHRRPDECVNGSADSYTYSDPNTAGGSILRGPHGE
jgi:hypothetical protein